MESVFIQEKEKEKLKWTNKYYSEQNEDIIECLVEHSGNLILHKHSSRLRSNEQLNLFICKNIIY